MFELRAWPQRTTTLELRAWPLRLLRLSWGPGTDAGLVRFAAWRLIRFNTQRVPEPSMKFRRWAWAVCAANALLGVFGILLSGMVLRAAQAGVNHPRSGPEQFGIGMMVGGVGLAIGIAALFLLGLAAGGFWVAKRAGRRVEPGLAAKVSLLVGTLTPLLAASAAAVIWF